MAVLRKTNEKSTPRNSWGQQGRKVVQLRTEGGEMYRKKKGKTQPAKAIKNLKIKEDGKPRRDTERDLDIRKETGV